jgi:hypothetical protein
MRNSVVAYVGWLLLAAALAFYVYGIEEAIRLSWSDTAISPTAFSPEIATTISAIQAVLLTNLGAVLGISVAKPNSAMARQLLLNRPTGETDREISNPLDMRDKIQLFAMIVYLLSLIAAVVTWRFNNFETDATKVVPLISESGKMFIGVVMAYITAVLAKSSQ